MSKPPFSLTDLAAQLGVSQLTYQPINQGHSQHQHWCIQAHNQQWFLTAFHPKMKKAERRLRLNRQRWAQQHAFSPPTLLHDPDLSYFVTDYLPMPTPWWHDRHAIYDLIERIASLHRIAPQTNDPIANHVSSRLKRLWTHYQHLPVWHDKQHDFLQTLSTPSTSTWTHQDLHPLNVRLHQGRTWLCDWEYAGLGEPASDVCMMHQYLPANLAQLWLQHFPLDQTVIQKQYTQQIALCCLWALDQADPQHIAQALQRPPPLATLQQAFLNHQFNGDFASLFASAHQAWLHQIR